MPLLCSKSLKAFPLSLEEYSPNYFSKWVYHKKMFCGMLEQALVYCIPNPMHTGFLKAMKSLIVKTSVDCV